MPVSLPQIATNTASVSFRYGDDTVTITYYPGRYTEKMVGDVQAISKLDENTIVSGFSAFNETLASLIKDWDVYEDEAMTSKFPIDPTHFSELPLGFRMQIFGAISGDIRPEMIAPQIQTQN
jgi:hypothetical protein